MDICKTNLCTGCGVCAAKCIKNAIKMQENEYGFIMPFIDSSVCIECGLCKKVCPQLYPAPRNQIKESYKAQGKDLQLVKDSTSGGVVTAIALKYVQEQGVYYGTILDKTVGKYIECTDVNDVLRCQGSKYIQCEIAEYFEKIKIQLEKNVETLFVGTSCQVDALKKYLGRGYENLLTIDFVCHGVGSSRIFRMFLEDIVSQKNESMEAIDKILFRSKESGYLNSQFVVSFVSGNNYKEGSYQNPFGYGFASDLLTRESCVECKYASVERVSDLTVADFTTDLSEDEKQYGVSLCCVNTAKGKKVLDTMQSELLLKKMDLEYVCKHSYHLTHTSNKNLHREKFYKQLETMPFEKLKKKYLTPRKKMSYYTKLKMLYRY